MQETFERLPRVAFWLVPQEPDRKTLEKHIVALSRDFSAPQFVPHVTLYSCARTLQQQELALLARFADGSRPITMLADGLSGKERLSQALYIDLKYEETAFRLFRELAEGVSSPSKYTFDPHLSLLYQNLPEMERERLLKQLQINITGICFDQLWAVAIPERLDRLKDFTGWQPLMICRLDSKKNTVTL